MDDIAASVSAFIVHLPHSAPICAVVASLCRSSGLIQSVRFSQARITGLAELSGGAQVLSCSRDHSLQLWDLRTERSVKTLIHKGGAINGMAVHPDKVGSVLGGRESRPMVSPGYFGSP